MKNRPRKYPNFPKTVGEHILKRRLDFKLIQQEVANIIGVDKSTIIDWEHNSSPKAMQMKGIIAFLGYYPFSEPKTLGEKIKKYRFVHGLTYKGFATLVGFNKATVRVWEQATVPSFRNAATKEKVESLIS